MRDYSLLGGNALVKGRRNHHRRTAYGPIDVGRYTTADEAVNPPGFDGALARVLANVVVSLKQFSLEFMSAPPC